MDAYLQEFFDYVISQERSPITAAGYKGDITLFARWFQDTYGCPFQPGELRNEIIRAYKQNLLQQNAKPRTINRRMASLAIFGLWAQKTGYLQNGANPADGIKPAKQVEVAPRWLEPRERAKLLRVIDDEVSRAMTRFPRLRSLVVRDAAIVKLILNTGLRVSELADLRLTDINLEENRGFLVVRAGKGSKRRELPLNAEARQAVLAYLQLRPNLPVDSLFIGQNGEGVEKRTAQRSVSRFASLAGLNNVSCHTLRHTFAKTLIDRGVSLEKVAKLLGHSSLNTTQIYVTPGRKDLERAVTTLDQVDAPT